MCPTEVAARTNITRDQLPSVPGVQCKGWCAQQNQKTKKSQATLSQIIAPLLQAPSAANTSSREDLDHLAIRLGVRVTYVCSSTQRPLMERKIMNMFDGMGFFEWSVIILLALIVIQNKIHK